MLAGKLRHRIRIVAQPSTQDASGQLVDSGEPHLVSECWASVRTATSKEIYALGAGFTSQVTHAVTIRYPAKRPAAGMTILFRDRKFLVQAVSDPDEIRRELDLMVLELNK
jgi:SPP1 family predicted phage head-tail adaptor